MRDNKYWTIYNNLKTKYPSWTVAKIHAVTKSLVRKVAA